MPVSAAVIKALAVTGEIYGKVFDPKSGAAEMLAADLADYPEAAVLVALSRCRRELRSFPTVAEIIARIDDGRPGPEEAWAMIPQDEAASVVWTDEMAGAFGVARHLLDDPVAARMAFREAYTRLVNEARTARKPVNWTPSLGHDKNQRAVAIYEAQQKGRISAKEAEALLPEPISPRWLQFDVNKLLQEIPK